MRRTAAVLCSALLLVAACSDDEVSEPDLTPTTAGVAADADPFDPAAEVWVTATIGGGNELLHPGGVDVEVAAADVPDTLVAAADDGKLVELLTTGAPELECAAAFDGPSYEVTLHLTSGDVTVGTCGLGEALVQGDESTELLAAIDTALAAAPPAPVELGAGDPFDPAAEVWITATVRNPRFPDDATPVEVRADLVATSAELAELATLAADGSLVDQLTTGATETGCATPVDGPSYEITLHLTSGDVTVGTCGLGIPLFDGVATQLLFDVVFAAVAAD